MTRIRPATTADSDALGLITVSASLKAFVGQIPEQSLDFGWRPEASAAGWRTVILNLPESQFVLVAELDQRVVGFVWAGIAEGAHEGEIKGLYVLPTRHGQGIGRLLSSHAVHRLERDEAIKSLLIGCIKENRSCGFYRHLGGVEAYRRPSSVDKYQTEEIFFSWTDLSPFRLGNDMVWDGPS